MRRSDKAGKKAYGPTRNAYGAGGLVPPKKMKMKKQSSHMIECLLAELG